MFQVERLDAAARVGGREQQVASRGLVVVAADNPDGGNARGEEFAWSEFAVWA